MGVLSRLRKAGRDIGANVRSGRHIEAYATLVLGVALIVLSVLDVGDDRWLFAGILVGISFLVFHTTLTDTRASIGVELLDRDSFTPFSDLLHNVDELWVYGPTANSILVNVADIRRHILERAGSVRFIVQDPDQVEAVEASKLQLDDNLDFLSSLRISVGTLRRLQAGYPERVRYALLPMNPGFSLLVVNPRRHDGYLVLEMQGFKDDNINDRMHMVLDRQDASRWFTYWTDRFDAMWSAAAEQFPGPDSVKADTQNA
ncbi:hypothetical protein EV650_5579 [Kribbella kalugense]|uniref:Uncharacterized protein n=1 Tax=Kribbella kalugense TaxID=2512221 RepID=A0A4R7ZNR0_9ACTN|nr:hypothetical protein EV650_5579 [Kribbella kalugense]